MGTVEARMEIAIAETKPLAIARVQKTKQALALWALRRYLVLLSMFDSMSAQVPGQWMLETV